MDRFKYVANSLIILLLLSCSETDEDMKNFFQTLPSVTINYYNYPSALHALAFNEVAPDNIITVTPDGSFNQIRNILMDITDSSESNTYKVFLRNGTYEEFDVQVPSFVMLEGQSKEGVIINADGNSTKLVPDNYPFPAEIGKQIKDVSQSFTHGFWVYASSIVKSMTVIGNRMKYNTHQDTNGNFHAIWDNVHFIKNEVNDNFIANCGMGGRDGQIMSFWNCTLELNTPSLPAIDRKLSAFFWHNTNTESNIVVLELINNNVINNNAVLVTEQNSTQADKVIINGLTVSTNITWATIYYQLKDTNLVSFDISHTSLTKTEYSL